MKNVIEEGQDFIEHYGILGMRWGVRKGQNGSYSNGIKEALKTIEKRAYSAGAKINPREAKYKIRKITNSPNADNKLLAEYTQAITKQTGILPTNHKALKAVETMGIEAHKKSVYKNLNSNDIKNLKTYTDSARYSRSVNGYLAIGDPKTYAKQAEKLKNTLKKNTVDNQTVYRSCNMKFSMKGLAKKMDKMSDAEKEEAFAKMSRNFSGKSAKENRVYSTSTSPLFAIDTWRKVNTTASSTYNTYMIINCKKCPGIMADGSSNGKKLVNTRSNQEAILAPNKMTYRKLEFDKERQMFAITVDAE